MKRIATILAVGFFSLFTLDSVSAQCEPPSILWDEDGIILNWIAKDNANAHLVRYRLEGTFTWTEVIVEDNTFFDISFLETCEVYEFRVKSICDGVESSNSPLHTAAANCGTCFSTYCEIPSLDAGISNITYVQIKDFVNTSFNSSSTGYEDFRGSTELQLSPGEEAYLEINVNNGAFYNNEVAMYIDYNRNLEFESDELVISELITVDMPISTTFNVPTDINFGLTRIRFVLTGFSYSNPASCENQNTSFWGEVEEYCAVLGELPSACDLDFEAEVVDIVEGSATFEWEELNAAAGYNFRYKKTSESEDDWTTLSTFETFTTVNDFEDCEEYEFEIRGVCPFDTSAFKNRIVFESFCATASKDLSISELTAYPNPWSTVITLAMESQEYKEVSITAIGLNGQRFTAPRTIQLTSGSNQVELTEFAYLNAGVYMLEIRDNSGESWLHKTIKIQ